MSKAVRFRDFPDRLRAWMKYRSTVEDKRCTVVSLSKATGIAERTFHYWMDDADRRLPTMAKADIVLDVLNLDVHAFFSATPLEKIDESINPHRYGVSW
jgi:hypothetical protein